MRRLMSIAAAAATIAGGTAIGGSAQAGTVPDASLGVVTNMALPLEEIQFFWGGYNYCWYGNAWNGPGYYWCGYPWRYGYGWGGGYGWNGWRWGGGGAWRGGGMAWWPWQVAAVAGMAEAEDITTNAVGAVPAEHHRRQAINVFPDNDHEKRNYTESLKV